MDTPTTKDAIGWQPILRTHFEQKIMSYGIKRIIYINFQYGEIITVKRPTRALFSYNNVANSKSSQKIN